MIIAEKIIRHDLISRVNAATVEEGSLYNSTVHEAIMIVVNSIAVGTYMLCRSPKATPFPSLHLRSQFQLFLAQIAQQLTLESLALFPCRNPTTFMQHRQLKCGYNIHGSITWTWQSRANPPLILSFTMYSFLGHERRMPSFSLCRPVRSEGEQGKNFPHQWSSPWNKMEEF